MHRGARDGGIVGKGRDVLVLGADTEVQREAAAYARLLLDEQAQVVRARIAFDDACAIGFDVGRGKRVVPEEALLAAQALSPVDIDDVARKS